MQCLNWMQVCIEFRRSCALVILEIVSLEGGGEKVQGNQDNLVMTSLLQKPPSTGLLTVKSDPKCT